MNGASLIEGFDDEGLPCPQRPGRLGFLVFLVGAAAWRMAYQQPLVAALAVIHADRRRRVWIHLWMMAGTIVTPAGLAGLASLGTTATASTCSEQRSSERRTCPAGWAGSVSEAAPACSWDPCSPSSTDRSTSDQARNGTPGRTALLDRASDPGAAGYP